MSDAAVLSGAASAWRSWLGVIAVVLGLLMAAEHATELTRQGVIASATPASGQLPPAECPADELEEEGLSAAECQHLVDQIRGWLASAPPWFASAITILTSIGTAAAGASVLVGIALLQAQPRGLQAAIPTFALLAATDAGLFTAAVNAGPLLRAEYLWSSLIWFVLHLMMTMAALAGWRHRAAEEDTAASMPSLPFPRVVSWCHLLVALAVLYLFVSSWWMLALPLPSADFTYRAFPFQLHKNLGLTLAVLTLVMLTARMAWPAARRRLSPLIHAVAVLNHVLLYVLILAVAFSGYMSSSYSGWATTLWWLVDLPDWGYEDEARNIFWSDVHLWTCWLLLGVIAAHIGGALFHAFSNDGFVRRMLRL